MFKMFSFLFAVFAMQLSAVFAFPPGGNGGGNGGGGGGQPQPSVSYSIQFVPTLGGADIAAYGMNGHGAVVGLSETSVIGTRAWQHGYVYYSDTGTLVDLHDLFVAQNLIADPINYATGTGWFVQSADDINDNGQIIGDMRYVVNGKGSLVVPYRYTPASGNHSPLLESIPPLVEGKPVTPRAINNSGLVVGFAVGPDNFRHAIAFADAATGTVDLGLMNGQDTVPHDVNDEGVLCGSLDGVSRAWRLGFSGFENLGKLEKGKWGWSEGRSINLFGDVAGTSSKDSVTNRVFLYTTTTGMRDLGTLGGNDSWGGYVNNLGEVVGTSDTAEGGFDHAFLYTKGTMVDLEKAIVGFSTSPYFGLLEPQGINDAGQVFGVTNTGTGLIRKVFVLQKN